ncbi:hypothetical protein [Acinetobacter oleivorans]|uniref:hypothetical protein n=1 Tax=Acinetobacter oleivorans TaxID=1148157 RepID=UPI001CF0B75B|nr:hypothetical protein [Acinetobacter oleivorans]
MIKLANQRAALIAEVAEFKNDCMELWFVPNLARSYKNSSLFEFSILDEEVFFLKEQARQLWSFWNKAKAQAVPSQKYFSHDFNGDGFKYHDSLEEAQKEAEASLDWYRDKVADGHHVAEDGEFNELCYGVVIASADYTVDAVVTDDHHKKDEFTKYEVGTEILTLHLEPCKS